MGMIFLQGFLYPSSESGLNIDNHNLYLDDSTNEFVGINETTGAEVFRIPSGTPSSTIRTYQAMLLQNGTSAPVSVDLGGNEIDPFEDTLEGVWSYFGTGIYYYTKTGAFADSSKVYVSFGDNRFNQGADIVLGADILNDNVLRLSIGKVSPFASPAGFTPLNGLLYCQPIIIQVK
jgi:hypothetical protein